MDSNSTELTVDKSFISSTICFDVELSVDDDEDGDDEVNDY